MRDTCMVNTIQDPKIKIKLEETNIWLENLKKKDRMNRLKENNEEPKNETI